jgi:hypothetical protein
MQSGGLILILIGLLVLFGAVTGKLDCFLTALNTCYSQGATTDSNVNYQPSTNAPKAPTMPTPANPKLSTGATMIFT